MNDEALTEFRDFMFKVRNETISNFSGYLSGHYQNKHAQAVASAYSELKSCPEMLESYFLPEIVDEVLVILLQSLDESRFDLVRMAEGGQAAASLREQTESLGSAYELDWLPTVKKQS